MLEKSECLFWNKGTDHGSASKQYCDALQKLFEKHKNDVAMFVKISVPMDGIKEVH